MIKGTNFNLIYELFDHLFIFDDKNEIIFEGNSLKTFLCRFNLNLSDLHSDKLDDLKATINNVRNDLEPCNYKFVNIEEEFILFPSKMDDKVRVILAKKDNIIQIPKIEYDLNERAKELECLYRISTELESEKTLDEALTNCTKHTEDGFQFPQNTRVIIEIDNKLFGNAEFESSDVKDTISAEIKIDDKKRGRIKVYLFHNNGYLEEEKKLVNEIAGKLARAIEQDEKTINLEKQSLILRRKNESLIKLTEECHQRREKLRTFFSAITDKIVVIDKNYDIIISNKNDIGDSGKCYEKLFNLKEKCKACPAKDTFETAENSFKEREIEDKFLMLRSYPIFNQEGKADRVLEVCRDITTQKKMEAQLLQSYKLASLGKLVAGVAHEINNPNTFILGNLKIIQEAIKDIFPILDDYYKKNKDLKIARLNYELFKENISTLVEDMITGANRTKKIVADLRNFAKKDDGLLTEEIDINSIIKNNLTLTRKHIKKFARLDVELAERVPTFCGSANKLEQVLLNLIMNASEAIENGDGLIKLKTGYDEGKNEVLVIVEDNGCGMDDSVMRNIFDPFFTTKRNSGGTGLGLSITYGIIKDHNGNIDVESKIGKGTIFTLRFPAKSSD